MIGLGINSILFASNGYYFYIFFFLFFLKYLTSLSLPFPFLFFLTNSFFFKSAGDAWLSGGTLPSILKTLNYGVGTDVAASFKILRKYQPTGPLFVTEFWDGWYI